MQNKQEKQIRRLIKQRYAKHDEFDALCAQRDEHGKFDA
jgi:hypothetical protein